jgi:hypothetical protein
VTWGEAPPLLRTLARWVSIVQAVGYTVSVVFVYHTTRITPAGAVTRYRGADPAAAESAGAAMQFPKPLGELLLSTHTHVLTIALMFAVSGLCFALCSWPSERWRRALIVEPFVAIVVSFGAIWLMRYTDPRFVWLLFVSSSVMAVTFYFQTAVVLWELRRSGMRASAGSGMRPAAP